MSLVIPPRPRALALILGVAIPFHAPRPASAMVIRASAPSEEGKAETKAGTPAGPAKAKAPLSFSLDSPLACTPAAREFIQRRLDQWDRELASVALLVEEIGGAHLHQGRILVADIHQACADAEERRYEEARSNASYQAKKEWDAFFVMESREASLKAPGDRAMVEVAQNFLTKMTKFHENFINLVNMDLAYDLASFASFAETESRWDMAFMLGLSGDMDGYEGESKEAPPTGRKLEELPKLTGALFQQRLFVRQWIGKCKQRLRADLALLEAHRADPTRPLSPCPRQAKAPERQEETPSGLEATLDAPVHAPGDSKASAAEPKGSFDPYYRFVDCTASRVPDSSLGLSRSLNRIRQEIDDRSMHLDSTKVVRLVQALEPFGARCEADRRKGIMLKLPTGDKARPYEAKFIHRTHASHDSLDRPTIENLKQLFDRSIFTMDKF